ncbi:hypothetical protein D3C81_881460 [compost metagenome]
MALVALIAGIAQELAAELGVLQAIEAAGGVAIGGQGDLRVGFAQGLCVAQAQALALLTA